MAFDVLGNDLYRAIYDRYGEAGLFEGVMLPNGYFPPYQYDGDHMKVYERVFGSYSPYANVIDAIANPPSLYATRQHGIGVRSKDASTERIIELSLEEVRTGCVKLMNVWRQEIVDTKEQYYKRIEPADAHVLQKALRRTAPNSNSSANNTTANSNSRSKARQFTFV